MGRIALASAPRRLVSRGNWCRSGGERTWPGRRRPGPHRQQLFPAAAPGSYGSPCSLRSRQDGTYIDISLTVSPINNANGVVVGASKIARDITERKRSEAQIAALA